MSARTAFSVVAKRAAGLCGVAGALALVTLLAARNLHYLAVHLPSPVEIAIDRLMHIGMHTVVLLSALHALGPFFAVVLLLAMSLRPGAFLERRTDGRRAARAWLTGAVW